MLEVGYSVDNINIKIGKTFAFPGDEGIRRVGVIDILVQIQIIEKIPYNYSLIGDIRDDRRLRSNILT